eukprot:Seg442.3 transcript_id=Seg442.3/GoldUCD/mRNA.D3Y31 product="hypothetical protein" protein_id=Seg442.3/GoldUCD/D3Y31
MAFSMTFATVAKFMFVLLSLACKERSFITSCPLAESIEDYGKWERDESFICSSLWVNKEVNLFCLRPKPRGVVTVLLLMAGDIETCPGPVVRKVCFGCRKTIRKNQRNSKCDGCKKILHFKCLGEDQETTNNGLKCYSCLQLRTRAHDNTAESTGVPMVNIADETCFEEFQSYVKARGLKILHQNVCGLLRVLDHIKILLHEVKGIDIFGISESHLSSLIDDEELKIPGYELH